jgi:serine/threonine-protein kinase HipA
MILDNTNQCLITLAPSATLFSNAGKRFFFGNKECDPIIDYTQNEAKLSTASLLIQNQTKISISGVQDKYSLLLKKGKLQLTDIGGTYILKPKPHSLEHVEYVPINEHVTMTIARTIFKLDVAKCGLVLFANKEPAYITKRFDVLPNQQRCLKEDFASVLQRTSNTHGKSFKYDASYLDLFTAIDKYLPANMLEKEKLFKLILFNYIISNGDAHLKNFSVLSYNLQNPYYQLAPAYDLLCTALHIDDGNLALHGGLYDGDINHPSFSKYGIYKYEDFYDFGIKVGLLPKRIQKMITLFTTHNEAVVSLVNQSFLSADLKEKYSNLFLEKVHRLIPVQ